MQQPDCLQIDQWLADRKTNTLRDGSISKKIEPKTMDVLFLLMSRSGEVLSKDEIMGSIWKDTVVGEDTLARAISMLRKAFDDDPKKPRFIETIPKRGYRFLKKPQAQQKPTEKQKSLFGHWWLAASLVAVVAIALLVIKQPSSQPTTPLQAERLTRLADDFYYQFKRADNEAAIKLYERVIAESPNYGPSQSGLANALVQKVLRWPNPINTPDINHQRLADAIEQGRTKTPQAKQHLQRAQALAERATRLAPGDPYSYRALGLVHAVQENYAEAKTAYNKALNIDPQSWEVLINMADILHIEGQDKAALTHMERAYSAMQERYHDQPTHIRPWQAKVAVAIGEEYEKLGQHQEAEIWYRQVLSYSPYHPEATLALAQILHNNGETQQARNLCEQLKQNTGSVSVCDYDH